MNQSLDTTVDAVASAREIELFELRPVEISGRAITDTTAISISLDQALRLRRRLDEAIAAASDEVYSSRQTWDLPPTSLNQQCQSRVRAITLETPAYGGFSHAAGSCLQETKTIGMARCLAIYWDGYEDYGT